MSEKTPKKRKGLKPALIIAAVLALFLADSNFRLSVSKYAAGGARLPNSFEGYKIVALSDLHGASFGRNNGYIRSEIEKLAPDIIVITGDFISGESDLAPVRDMLSVLTKIAPVYCVTGNHDWAGGLMHTLQAIFNETGAVCLHNEYITLELPGGSIVLCGAEDPNSWSDLEKPDSLVARARKEYPDSYLILLGHRNYWAQAYPDLDADLILCGHGHGGVIRLPLVGGILDVNSSLFPKFSGGLYESGPYQMIVSRGLGQVPFIPRFLNNPEICEVTLKKP